LTGAESAPCRTDKCLRLERLASSDNGQSEEDYQGKGYWRSESQKLRSLNKHWCCCLNSQIASVRPDNRIIRPADARSLLKFPKPESMDIFLFVCSDTSKGKDLLLVENWWCRVDKSERKRRLLDVLDVAAEIPNLRELLIDEKPSELEESFLDIAISIC